MSSNVTIVVEIVDTNDEAPIFSESQYRVSVFEDTLNGSFILQVMARDDDTSEPNSLIRYQIQELDPGSGMDNLNIMVPFYINPTTGVVSLNGDLDFEMTQDIPFVVLATDLGSPPQTGSAEVIVFVNDTNDNSPMFIDAPYLITLPENTPTGTTALVISAFDADSGINGEITFSLLRASKFIVDTINSSAAAIILDESLDFENQTMFNFTLVATDNGSEQRSTEANIIVRLENVNDNPPEFDTAPYRFTVSESSQLNIQLTAFDLDGDSVTYILGPGFEEIFELNAISGVLISAEGFQFDFENQQQYSLVAYASDGVQNTSVMVIINITDENDNPPRFLQDEYTVTVLESIAVSSVVLQVNAIDEDTGTNAAITYNIVLGNIGNAFAVNPESGVIIVNSSLDFDQLPVEYNLTITAQNTAPPHHSDEAFVLITLTNVDDIAPMLSIDTTSVSVTENSDPVFIAPTLIISDADTQSAPISRCSITFDACPDRVGLDCVLDSNEHLILNESLLNGNLEFASFGPYPDNSSQILMINGNSSKEVYRGLLASLVYVNSAPEPRPGERDVQLQCFNGRFYSNILEIILDVRLIDEFCVEISSSITHVNYTEDMGNLDVGEIAAFVLTDPDRSPHNIVSRIQLTLQRLDGDYEYLSVTVPSGLDVADGTSSGSSPLTMESVDEAEPVTDTSYSLLISGEASIDTYTQVLRSLIYVNNRSEPSLGERYIIIMPIDDSLNCRSLQLRISVIPINDRPPELLFNTTQPLLYVEEFGAFDFAARVDLRIVDPDHNDLFPMERASILLDGVRDIGMENLSFDSSLRPSDILETYGKST